MAERHTQSEDIQKDVCDSMELDWSSCTGSHQESNPTQSSPFGSDGESQSPPYGASDQKVDDCSERETSREKRKGARLAKKTRGKAKGGGSDRLCGQDRCEDSSDDENAASLAEKKRCKRKAVKKNGTTRVKVKRAWNEAEKEVIERHFGIFITQRRIPRKEHCVKFLREEKGLADRSWKHVKNYVYKTMVSVNRRSAWRRLFF